ncbi:hypothetical protein ACFXTH_026329 [Malus domestica]
MAYGKKRQLHKRPVRDIDHVLENGFLSIIVFGAFGDPAKKKTFTEATYHPPDDMLIAQDEIFGPVTALMKFKTIEEAIQRANNTRYGLAAGIITKDLNAANTVSRSIRAGIIWINCYFAFDRDCPYGGYKMSGFARDFGMQAL